MHWMPNMILPLRLSAGNVIEIGGIDQIGCPDHCAQNTPGSRLLDELIIRAGDFKIRKETDPVSRLNRMERRRQIKIKLET